jgi:hypothetical protein
MALKTLKVFYNKKWNPLPFNKHSQPSQQIPFYNFFINEKKRCSRENLNNLTILSFIYDKKKKYNKVISFIQLKVFLGSRYSERLHHFLPLARHARNKKWFDFNYKW